MNLSCVLPYTEVIFNIVIYISRVGYLKKFGTYLSAKDYFIAPLPYTEGKLHFF